MPLEGVHLESWTVGGEGKKMPIILLQPVYGKNNIN